MNSKEWPSDDAEASVHAREVFVSSTADSARYWIKWSLDFLYNSKPEKPYIRPSSEIARQDAEFRSCFSQLTSEQKETISKLLNRSISGAVFSTLCNIDQFPNGEVSIYVKEGFDEVSGRIFMIAPTEMELHDDFYEYYKDVSSSEIARDA